MENSPAERTCRKCGETKPLEKFVKAMACKHGRTHVCLVCRSAQNREVARARGKDPEVRARRRAKQKRRDADLLANAAEGKKVSVATARARREGAVIVEPVVALVVLERDDGVCGICGEDVDPFDFTLDHIIPCKAGGKHSYANVQLAHRACNSRKNDSEDKAWLAA